jgi:hypothetical protein
MKPLEMLAVIALASMAAPIMLYQRLRELEQEASTSIHRLLHGTACIICYPFAVLMAMAVQLLTSRMLDLLRVWSMSLFYSSYIFVIRDVAPRAGLTGSEDGWAFGQAVAVFMLLLPVFGIIEAYLGTCFKWNHGRLLLTFFVEERPKYEDMTSTISSGAQTLPTHKPQSQDNAARTTSKLTETPTGILAQMRTIRPVSTNARRNVPHNWDGPSTRNKINGETDVDDEHYLFAARTDSDGWAESHRTHRHDMGPRAPASDRERHSMQRWRERWPIIETFAAFEREHYENSWFGPLMIVIVLLLFASTTVLGLTLVVITEVR